MFLGLLILLVNAHYCSLTEGETETFNILIASNLLFCIYIYQSRLHVFFFLFLVILWMLFVCFRNGVGRHFGVGQNFGMGGVDPQYF